MHPLTTPPMLVSAWIVDCRPFSSQIVGFELNRLYKDPLRRSREEAVEKHEIHETEADPAKIGGGNAAGAIPGCVSTLSNTSNTAMMMKGE